MKVSEELLRKLAQLAQTDRTVLSAYLDLRKGWDAAKDFIDRESERLLPLLDSQERDYFKTSLSFMFGCINEKRAEKFRGPGVAFFAALGADFTSCVGLTAAPEPFLAVDNEAIIHPLALELDEYEPIGVIMIDAHCTRILTVAGRTMEDMDAFCRKIHHLSKAGGWSQMRYQRRRAKQIKHFAKEIIEKAIAIFDEAGIRRIVIAGRNRMITALEQVFPKQWRDKVIATVPWDLDAADKEFLGKIRPILEETERNQEKDLLEKLVTELRRGGLAVAGVEPTRTALTMAQVDTLFVSKGIDFKTAEELTSLAEATAAYVEFVPQENEILVKLGGVAALLRFGLGHKIQ